MDADDESVIDGLLARALAAGDDSTERWRSIEALQAIGSQGVFASAVALCGSDDGERRAIGVQILAHLGARREVVIDLVMPVGDHAFPGETVELLLEMLSTECDPVVLDALGHAVVNFDDPRCVAPLVALRGHADDRVRRAVVSGLLHREHDIAVEALVELSSDPSKGIRDWATFGLGAMIDRDTPQVREALAALLAAIPARRRTGSRWSTRHGSGHCLGHFTAEGRGERS